MATQYLGVYADLYPAYTGSVGGGGGTPTIYTPTAQQYKYSGPNALVNGRVRPDPLSVAIFSTNAVAPVVEVVSTNNYVESAVVNVALGGVSYASLQVNPSPGTQDFPLNGLASGNKSLALNVGGQGRDNEQGDIVFQTPSITVPAGFTGSFQSVVKGTGKGYVFFVDSIGCGARTPDPGRDAYIVSLRGLQGADIYAMGYGSLRLYNHIRTYELRAAELEGIASRLAGYGTPILVLPAGTNDYGFATGTPTELGSWVQAFFTEAKAAIPNLRCVLMTLAPRTGEGANALGFTGPQYRTAMAAGATAAGGEVIDGTTIFDLADIDARDGVHYNTASGNAKVAARLNSYFNANGSGASFTTSAQQLPYITSSVSGGNGTVVRGLIFGSTAGVPTQWRMKFKTGAFTAWQDSNIFSTEAISPATGVVSYECRLTSNPGTVVANTFFLSAFYAPLDAGGFTFVGPGWTTYPGLPTNSPFALAYNDQDTEQYAGMRTIPANATFYVFGRKQPNISLLDISYNGEPRSQVNITGSSFDSNCALLVQGTAPAGGYAPRTYRNANSPAQQVSYLLVVDPALF